MDKRTWETMPAEARKRVEAVIGHYPQGGIMARGRFFKDAETACYREAGRAVVDAMYGPGRIPADAAEMTVSNVALLPKHRKNKRVPL